MLSDFDRERLKIVRLAQVRAERRFRYDPTWRLLSSIELRDPDDPPYLLMIGDAVAGGLFDPVMSEMFYVAWRIVPVNAAMADALRARELWDTMGYQIRNLDGQEVPTWHASATALDHSRPDQHHVVFRLQPPTDRVVHPTRAQCRLFDRVRRLWRRRRERETRHAVAVR